MRSLLRFLARALVAIVLLVLILIGVGIAVLETGWAKNEIRALIVRQANQYLTAELQIDELSGSLFRGLELDGIRLSREGRTLVSIDHVALSYSIRELLQQGVVLRRIALVRPRITASRGADGRWDLGRLVKREAQEQERTGPGRPIEIVSIEISDATVTLSDPVQFGAAHIPTRYEKLDASLSFTYVPVRWALNFSRLSFRGSAPDLTIDRLTGGIENGPAGLVFNTLAVVTPRSDFTLDGKIEKGDRPTTIDLDVHAPRFAFQEWGGIINGLRNIAIEARFDTALRGPLTRLDADLQFQSTGGGIRGAFWLNTTVPGWRGAGTVNVDRINLARWLSKPDKSSDITGRVAFDLEFGFGAHFPRGTYSFDGPHAMYMNYAGDNIRARGRLTDDAALVTEATAVAYGAAVSTANASIGLSEPFPFHFPGTIAALDLRRLPAPIPVPHVESALAFEYDVTGQFSDPFIAGGATFARSEFLGATIGEGMVGTIDTGAEPLTFGGDGEIDGIDLRRFGEGLDVGWMRDPRYAGTVSGRFRVAGSGTDRHSLTIAGGGRLRRADMLGGRLADANVTIDIAAGSLRASFDGGFTSIDPSIAFAGERYKGSLTGSARVRVGVRELLLRSPAEADYDIEGTAALGPSTIRGIALTKASFEGAYREGATTIRRVDVAGPALEASGTGVVAPCPANPAPICPTDFSYDIARADLERLRPFVSSSVTGVLATKGRLTGSLDRPHVVGDATVTRLVAPEFEALTMSAHYDISAPSLQFESAVGRAEVRASLLKVFGRSMVDGTGTLALAGRRLTFDLQVKDGQGRNATIAGNALVGQDQRQVTVPNLTFAYGRAAWRLASSSTPPTVAWGGEEVSLTPMTFMGPTTDERIAVSGTWRADGRGALRVVATRVFLDTIQGGFETPARYGGVMDLDATLRGTRQHPLVTGRIDITSGRFRRFSYDRLAGRVDYAGSDFTIDLRLDQAPGVWLVAAGTVPLSLFDRELPERPFNVAITSSQIGLGLLEGVTETVKNVSGQVRLDVRAVGTSHDPHFQGLIEIGDAAFLVTSTGARYQNGRATLRLATDRVEVASLHVEDTDGRSIEVSGSLGTHEMRVGDLEINVTARRVEVLRNEFGRVEIDADLRLRGRFESPTVVGTLSIASGTLNVDEILERTLLRPYATEPMQIANTDAIAALNPWSRMGLDITLSIPQELRLSGADLQVAAGTPIGLGDVNLRVGGDLYLYKDPDMPLSITGSLDRVTGWYRFQGRRFDIDEAGSSINFFGDVNPEMYVTVKREISGVETRITILGDLRNPELRLASTPSLDPSDILSLIVFNQTTNALTAPQQQELAVRAATIAAGFFAKPIVAAIERSLGLDILEIETNNGTGRGTRVTVGQEIAPGLVARFGRQFGQDEFNEATVEYYLSRILRIRATFSDAGSLTLRSPFRRVERAGVDLLLFFSF